MHWKGRSSLSGLRSRSQLLPLGQVYLLIEALAGDRCAGSLACRIRGGTMSGDHRNLLVLHALNCGWSSDLFYATYVPSAKFSWLVRVPSCCSSRHSHNGSFRTRQHVECFTRRLCRQGNRMVVQLETLISTSFQNDRGASWDRRGNPRQRGRSLMTEDAF